MNGQPSVIGEKKFYAFATDVSLIKEIVSYTSDQISFLSSGGKGIGVFVQSEVCTQRYCS